MPHEHNRLTDTSGRDSFGYSFGEMDVSQPAVTVVQSGDLAAWVGAISGLAGVVLGAGIDALRRRMAESKRKWRDIDLAVSRLPGLSNGWAFALAKAREHPNSAWVQVAVDREAAFTD